MIFPLISKLLLSKFCVLYISRALLSCDNKQDFKNPACFAQGLDEYTDKMEELHDSGSHGGVSRKQLRE